MKYFQNFGWAVALLAAVCWAGCTGSSGTGDAGLKPDVSKSALVGSWISECLTPDPNSPYSEKHGFNIKEDGTAIHTRINWDQPNCVGNTDQKVDSFQYEIPNTGEINLTGADGIILDIYQISKGQLMFGHGFRNTLSYSGAVGLATGARITTLNNYIVYSKSGATTDTPVDTASPPQS